MPNLISGFCFIRTTTICMCYGLVFVGLAVAAHTAQSEENFFAPDLDILSVQLAHSDASWRLPYRINTNVVLARPADTSPTGSGFSNTPRFQLIAEPKKEAIWPINANRQQTYDSGRILLPRLLSVEFKGERANITFRPRSVSIEGERLKVTFRPQSALIEGERLGMLKIMLQPHTASVAWGNTF